MKQRWRNSKFTMGSSTGRVCTETRDNHVLRHGVAGGAAFGKARGCTLFEFSKAPLTRTAESAEDAECAEEGTQTMVKGRGGLGSVLKLPRAFGSARIAARFVASPPRSYGWGSVRRLASNDPRSPSAVAGVLKRYLASVAAGPDVADTWQILVRSGEQTVRRCRGGRWVAGGGAPRHGGSGGP